MSIPGPAEYRGLPRRFRQKEHGRSDSGPVPRPCIPHGEQVAVGVMAQRQEQPLNDPTCLAVLGHAFASQACTNTGIRATPTVGFAPQGDLSELAGAVRRLLRHRPDLARPLTGSEYPFL